MTDYKQSATSYLTECFNLNMEFWHIIIKKLHELEDRESPYDVRWSTYWAMSMHYMWASDLILVAEGYRECK